MSEDHGIIAPEALRLEAKWLRERHPGSLAASPAIALERAAEAIEALVVRAKKAEEQRDRASKWARDQHHRVGCPADDWAGVTPHGACDCGLSAALADEPEVEPSK